MAVISVQPLLSFRVSFLAMVDVPRMLVRDKVSGLRPIRKL